MSGFIVAGIGALGVIVVVFAFAMCRMKKGVTKQKSCMSK